MLKGHLESLASLLDASVVSLSGALFEPYGASAAMLFGQQDSALAHLDKSHIAVHTYFESDRRSPWQVFRAEVEASTCGDLNLKPLLAEMIGFFPFDFLTLDYRVRGFARNATGELCLPVGTEVSDMADGGLVETFQRVTGQDRFGVYRRAAVAPEKSREVTRLVDQIQ
jgi:S-adenosylmethionine/arginine decarboxylase-like enzyme